MTVLGIDRSHWNAEPDFAAFAAAGGGLVFCKATEGTSFVDPTFAACRAGTEAAGMIFGSYHFTDWGNVAAEAAHYLATASPRPGELVALDDEKAIPAGVDVVAWSEEFSQLVHDAVGAWPLIYMNQSWLTGHNWAAVARTDGLWLAKYDGQPTGGPLGAWPVMALKQYTDNGSVPGMSPADMDAFQGTIDQLRRYAVPGSPAPSPAPSPKPAPPPPWDALPTLTYGMMDNAHVRSLQAFLAHGFPVYRHTYGNLPATGNYLAITAAWVQEFQRRSGLTLAEGADGRIVGPLTKHLLWNAGWRG